MKPNILRPPLTLPLVELLRTLIFLFISHSSLRRFQFSIESPVATIVFFFYLICLKIGLICFTYENFYQFFFYSSKLIPISVEITALSLSYHLYNGVRHLLTDFSLEEKD